MHKPGDQRRRSTALPEAYHAWLLVLSFNAATVLRASLVPCLALETPKQKSHPLPLLRRTPSRLPPDSSTSNMSYWGDAAASTWERRESSCWFSASPLSFPPERDVEKMSDGLCVVGSWFGEWRWGKGGRLWLWVVLSEVSLYLHRFCWTTSRQVQLSLLISSLCAAVFKHLLSSQLVAIVMSSKRGYWWPLWSLISSWRSSSLSLYSASWRSSRDGGTLTVSAAFLFLMAPFYFTHTKMGFYLSR